MASGELWTILLAAGDAAVSRDLTQLASGATVPKQYCSLVGPTSLLRLALARALRIAPAERTLAVVSARHRHWWRRDLPELPRDNVLVQPADRGTAPAVLLAAREIWRRDRDATLLVVPADHFVEQEWTFAVALFGACDLARKRPKRIVVVGVEPSGAETGYSWIVPDHGRRRKRAVAAIVADPDVAELAALVAAGAAIQTSIVAARAATLLEVYEERLPRLAELFRQHAPTRPHNLAATYREIGNAGFSRQVLERSVPRLELVVAPRCGWSDLATPERIAVSASHGGPPVKVFGHAPAAPVQLAGGQPRSLVTGT